MSEFSDISNALADVVEKAGESVVRVEGRRRIPASGIVWSADGVIVSAHHVIRRDEGIQVGLPGKESMPATLVGRDPTTDVAVLKVDATDLAATAWADDSQLRVGQLVLALGRPGTTVQASMGIVRAAGGAWRTPGGGKVARLIQADLVMYPGFSGGPLVAADGSIAGLNTSALWRGAHVAMPKTTVEQVVADLLAHGRVRKGYLGIGIQTVKLSGTVAAELDQETGVLINSVEPDSPAEESGLLVGDILVVLGDQPVRHPDDLAALLRGERAGQTVPAKIVRAGAVQEISVTIGERT